MGIIVCFIFIIMFSMFFGYPLWNPQDCGTMMERIDSTPNNPYIVSQHDCEEGCIYAEWVVYGYQKLTKPVFYTECAEACSEGDKYWKKR